MEIMFGGSHSTNSRFGGLAIAIKAATLPRAVLESMRVTAWRGGEQLRLRCLRQYDVKAGSPTDAGLRQSEDEPNSATAFVTALRPDPIYRIGQLIDVLARAQPVLESSFGPIVSPAFKAFAAWLCAEILDDLRAARPEPVAAHPDLGPDAKAGSDKTSDASRTGLSEKLGLALVAALNQFAHDAVIQPTRSSRHA